MKDFRILFVGLFLLLISCAKRTGVSSFQVVEYSDDFISMDITGNVPEYTAIYQLLFRGIPNSNQTSPVISTSEEEVWRNNPAYFEEFFNKNRYKTFIISSFKNDKYSSRVSVNLKALEADLEHHSIIRKFGY